MTVIDVTMRNGQTYKFKPEDLDKTVVDSADFIASYELEDYTKPFAVIPGKMKKDGEQKITNLKKDQISEVICY